MTPAELRAAALATQEEAAAFAEVNPADPVVAALLVTADAARRLADVIEMHKPVRPGIYAEVECWKCHDYSNDPIEWPCPTAVAALGEETAYRLKYERGEAKA